MLWLSLNKKNKMTIMVKRFTWWMPYRRGVTIMIERENKNYGENCIQCKILFVCCLYFFLFQLDTGIPMMFSSYHWSVTAKEWDIISTPSGCNIFWNVYSK